MIPGQADLVAAWRAPKGSRTRLHRGDELIVGGESSPYVFTFTSSPGAVK